jgi:hypothetical protein
MVRLADFSVSFRTIYIIPRMAVYKYEFEMVDVNYSRSTSILLVNSNDSKS